MTCKTNEAVALNTHQTKQVVLENEIVALKADKTHRRKAEEVNKLLVQLGNYGKTIPFIAIYAPDTAEPILLDGLVSQEQVINALKRAGTPGGAE
jgi:thiol:disulfide interchange protein